MNWCEQCNAENIDWKTVVIAKTPNWIQVVIECPECGSRYSGNLLISHDFEYIEGTKQEVTNEQR